MEPPLKIKEIISYGFCGLSYELEFITISTYLQLFCTNVMGIAAAALSVLFLAGNIIDAVTDIAITNAADRSQSRHGHYRPWILICGIGLGVSLLIIFLFPTFLKTDGTKLAFMCAAYLIVGPVFATGVMCPTYALGTVITEDENGRRTLSAIRAVGESAGDILCSVSAMSIIMAFGGIRCLTGWRVMGTLFGAIIMAAAWIGFRGTRERIPVVREGSPEARMGLAEKISALLRVRQFYVVVGIILFLSIENAFSASFFTYFCIYNLCHEDWISILFTICMVVQVTANFAVPKLGERIGTRYVLYIAITVLAASYLSVFSARDFAGCALVMILRGIGHGLAFPSMYALVPGITDTVERKTGVYLPGLCSASVSFMVKIANGIGIALSTLALVWSGFSAKLAVQTHATLTAFRLSFALVPIACMVIAFVLTCLLSARWNMDAYETTSQNSSHLIL